MALRPWIRLTRPFTLLPPLLGVLSGAACAWGSHRNAAAALDGPFLATILVGSICASLLNAASNIVNQVYDLEIDRRNKPDRPLVTGEVSVGAAMRGSLAMYALALIPIWWVVPAPHDRDLATRFAAPWDAHACFWIYLAGLACTFVYSAPWAGRTKARGIGANLTIAAARGELLKVAGWAMVAPVAVVEPWFLGAVFFFFLLGSASTKDFSDMEGDRAGGCRTLPILHGPRKAAWMIAPSFVLPWLLLPLGLLMPGEGPDRLLTGNPLLLAGLGVGLAAWGGYTVWLMLRDPDALATTENHPSWVHMYGMMMAAQVGLGVAYLL